MNLNKKVETVSRLKNAIGRRAFIKGAASLGAVLLIPRLITACSEETPDKQEPSGATLLTATPGGNLNLPKPKTTGTISVEEALNQRRSIRNYSRKPLLLNQVSQLLWAAQGITSPKGYRTAPSAMASYPLRTYMVVGDVEDLGKGVYLYLPQGHELQMFRDGDLREPLAMPGMGQYYVKGGAIYLLFTSNTSAWVDKKFIYMEAGHASQNVYLQATALGLGSVVIGGFSADRTRQVLDLPQKEEPLYFMAIGNK